MNITEIEVVDYEIPLKDELTASFETFPSMQHVLVKIHTDEDIIGLGEGSPVVQFTGESRSSTTALIRDVLAPFLVGENPLAINRLHEEIFSLAPGSPTAIAAMEIALQDIRGKRANLPLYEYLGGAPNEPIVKAPFLVNKGTPEQMATDAAEAVDNGYDELVIKVGGNPRTDIERMIAIDEVVPEKTLLKPDANQAWSDAKTALRTINEIEPYSDVIEQPIKKSNIEDIAFLRERINIPLALDESVGTADDVRNLINRSAADIYSIKLMKSGGITEALKLNSIAQVANRPTQISTMIDGHIATAAGAHLYLATNNIKWNELVGPFLSIDGITDLEFESPNISVSGPGLGISIDENKLEKFATNQFSIE